MFEVIGALIAIVIIWSIGQAIAGLMFPRYGLKRAKLIYSKKPTSENSKRIGDYEWKVRRKYGSL
ncbi:MAG: hypothetical protein H8D23_24355 [Candidatus Brocadiales bacterium]|nr:hypothetical protein [Candidatus Brocadiales bacterium]